MKKRGVEVWVGYLMYLLFAILTLSMVLYAVDNYMKNRESEIIVKSCIRSLTGLYDTISSVLSCKSCSINYKIYVPPGCNLDINEYTDDDNNKYVMVNYTCIVYKKIEGIDKPSYINVIYNNQYPYKVNIGFMRKVSDIDTSSFFGKTTDNYVCINFNYDGSTLRILDGSC